MTVREFKEFCCTSDIVLKDNYNGRVFIRLDKYLDEEVTGFYPRFDLYDSNYSPCVNLQIVAWIRHDFDTDNKR